MFSQHGEEVAVLGVATACDVQDDPEEGWAGVEAGVGVAFAEDGEVRVEALQESAFHSH